MNMLNSIQHKIFHTSAAELRRVLHYSIFAQHHHSPTNAMIMKRHRHCPAEAPSLQEINIEPDRENSNVFNVQLNRPEKRNTFTMSFWRELKAAFDYLDGHSQCRAIVLSANGPMFCAGIDLKEGVKDIFEMMNDESLDVARRARALRHVIQVCQDSFSSLEKCSKPVIAAVHSYCIGAGISLAACADVRYASNDAVFSIREVDIGIAADVGILQRIHLIAGNDSWARELAFTGRDVSATEALKFGFVSRVLDTQEDCREAAMDLAWKIASKSPVAVQGSKLAMNYARSHSVQDSLEWVLNWNAAQLQTEDISASLRAKMAKKPMGEFEDV